MDNETRGTISNQDAGTINMSDAKGLRLCAIATAGLVTVAAAPASASIKCVKGFQLVQGNYLATPYCQDQIVAEVAREYGVRTSAAQIRNNPNHKRHVCRLIGRDLRVQESCLTVNPGGRARSF